MAIDAKEFLDNAKAILPGLEMAAKITGLKFLSSVAAVLRRAVDNPESHDLLLSWLRWTPLFTGVASDTDQPPAAAEPVLPECYADLANELAEVREGIQSLSLPTDPAEPNG